MEQSIHASRVTTAAHPKALSRLPAWAVLDFSAYFCSNSFFTFSRKAKGTCRPDLRNRGSFLQLCRIVNTASATD